MFVTLGIVFAGNSFRKDVNILLPEPMRIFFHCYLFLIPNFFIR